MPDQNETPNGLGAILSSTLSNPLLLIKILWDLARFGIPVLWVAFQFYGHQNELLTSSKQVDSRIGGLEKQLIEQDKKLNDIQSEMKYFKEQFNHDLAFIEQRTKR